jgi:thiamine biosynthesis lipoprotein
VDDQAHVDRTDARAVVRVAAAPSAATRERPPTLEPALRRFGRILGQPLSLDFHDALPPATLDRLADEVFAWLNQVDALFSVSRADSEINVLDQGLMRPGAADPLVREVLGTCARLHDRTDGYFDVHATGRLDPSGYVRGWAIQRASHLLTDAGAGNHCLKVGEDVSASGRPAPDFTWRVRIEDPCRPEDVAWIQTATDLAVATARNHPPGDRIRNPMTRRPASGLTSVTVAGHDLGNAGAYATAAVAMGTAGLDWLLGLKGHAYAAIDDEGRCFHGGCLPGVLLT